MSLFISALPKGPPNPSAEAKPRRNPPPLAFFCSAEAKPRRSKKKAAAIRGFGA
jgi:hypothetical protein